MSPELEPAIWSRDTGQRIPCFEWCQLTATWMSKGRFKPRVHVLCQPTRKARENWSLVLVYVSIVAAMLRDSTTVAVVVVVVVVVVVRTRPRAIPLAMIHMRKSVHGFPSVS